MSDLEDELHALAARSQSLAIARYLQAHPDARERVDATWLDSEVERWSQQPTEEIEQEAARRLDELDEWEGAAEVADRELWETRRPDALHARSNLASARSGAFGTAEGSLADFLRAAGDQPNSLGFF